MSDLAKGMPLVLAGDALARGRAQAAATPAGPVVQAIRQRLDERAALFARPDIRAFLARQWDFAAAHCGPEFAEMTGIAEGFDLAPRDLFDFLHLGVVADLAGTAALAVADADGCSAWALAASDEGPAVGKNRDFRGEHAGLQRVFLHADPAWGGRRVLCVGSLGAPGAYSSGMNSDGFALADTAVATTDHGVGWLRYFLMTRLLARHATVAPALDDLRGLVHAGGGSLVLADASGAVAAVDLGHRKVQAEAADGWTARTNHFLPGSVAGAPDGADSSAESAGRLAALRGALAAGTTRLQALRALMASHDEGGATGLCRHPVGEGSRTLSGAVFACRPRVMYFCPGNPCETAWVRYSMDG
ncbi:MAG: C45 family autoproteolytic acyltransferase/hydrolase [Bacteroidota bacterium]|nr:C45 family peptidase [Kiloniellaceae bacterium]